MGQGDQAGWVEAIGLRFLTKEAGRAAWGKKRKEAGWELSPGGLRKRIYFFSFFLFLPNLLPNANEFEFKPNSNFWMILVA
jgi:hypothetical protein